VDVVDFVDQPLSENTGLNVGVPLESAIAALGVLCADPRLAALTVTEHNPLHGAEDGSTTAALAGGLVRALRAAA
jgi:arginase